VRACRACQLILPLLLLPLGTIADNKSDLQDLRSRIQDLQRQLENKEGDRVEAADQLRNSERQISEINRRLRKIRNEEGKLAARLVELSQQRDTVSGQIEEQRRLLGDLLKHHYQQGDADFLRLALNLKNPSQTARNLHYYGFVGRSRAAMIEQYEANLEHLDALSRETEEKRAHLASLKKERSKEKASLSQEHRARSDLLAKLSKEIHNQRQELTTLQEDERRLAQLVKRLSKMVSEKAAKKSGPGLFNREVPDASLADIAFRRLKGKLRLPVKGELTGRFGHARIGGGPSWKGLFIRAAQGEEVRAVADGMVVFADWLRGFGNLIILDHGSDYMSLYSNNESLYKQVGERVKAGDGLATVGNTGGQEESGLYFELRHKSVAFDPMTWIKSK
jgi:septal ring factor EnvC (AmiA/AmiB activator)